jgi:hypothetical protein
MMSEQGTGYSLQPWGNNTDHYQGHDDGGKDYTLPEGYTIAQSNGGTVEIYDEQGNHCEIITHTSGLPELVSVTRSVVLKLVATIRARKTATLPNGITQWDIFRDDTNKVIMSGHTDGSDATEDSVLSFFSDFLKSKARFQDPVVSAYYKNALMGVTL